MKRTAAVFAVILLASFLLVPSGAAAQQRGKVPRIGYLVLSPLLEPPSAERAGFLQGLRELGYEDGKNIVIEYRSAEGDPETLPFLVDELIELKVDVIVAPAGPPLLVAKEATHTIPIVMLFSADPVTAGLVESFARPGGNVTGMSMQNVELGGKRIELLKQAIPRISRVAVLWDSANVMVQREWEATNRMAATLGIKVESADVAGAPDFSLAFEQIRKSRPDALMTIVDLRTARYRQIIPEFALAERIPLMAGLAAFTHAGGLMSYAPDFADLSRRAAAYVDKILKGANPANLPVQQPTHYRLTVNLRTAKALGLEIPEAVLTRADEVLR
jgi:putative ABC transport system substrate-binding protein